jgi:hypothetical protein
MAPNKKKRDEVLEKPNKKRKEEKQIEVDFDAFDSFKIFLKECGCVFDAKIGAYVGKKFFFSEITTNYDVFVQLSLTIWEVNVANMKLQLHQKLFMNLSLKSEIIENFQDKISDPPSLVQLLKPTENKLGTTISIIS